MAERQNIDIRNILERLLAALREKTIRVAEAYLFGSFAHGENTEYSDIDIALVSEDFTGVRYLDIKKMGRIVRDIDCRIEIHSFSMQDKSNSMFLAEIIRTGIRVA